MNIFVSNLSQYVNDWELRKLFAAYGEVNSARVQREDHNGFSRGSAVVSMPDAEQGGRAIRGLNRMVLHGKLLEVSDRRPITGGSSVY